MWKTLAGWAEGYFLSAMRRAGQALEVRLLVEQLFDADASRLVAVAGDFNAEDHEVPLTLVVGAEENTGNPLLAPRALVVLDRAVPADRRWSVLHHGRRQMLDHSCRSSLRSTNWRKKHRTLPAVIHGAGHGVHRPSG